MAFSNKYLPDLKLKKSGFSKYIKFSSLLQLSSSKYEFEEETRLLKN